MFKRLTALLVCFTFSFSNLQYANAQDFNVNLLPVPGTMVGESAPFAPLALKGLVVNPKKPLEFQFIVDTGKGSQDTVAIKDQANQLVKYFLAGLTIPEDDLWVNLSPYEKNRMVSVALGQTDLGRDLLAQDYILKQLTASLIYPEKDLGKEFWSRVYAKAQVQFSTTNVPVNTFNKVWILPDQAQVFENVNAAYVTKSTLKVMLDEDYLALHKHMPASNGTDSIGSQIVRAIILPEIEKEVNTGKNFAPLRQIYQALILAKWYKETIQNGLLDAIYTNKNKVAGVNLNDPAVKEQIYERYLKAYKKGAFNYIKEDPTPDGQVMPRKYFSGGISKLEPVHVSTDGAMKAVAVNGAAAELDINLEDAAMVTKTSTNPGKVTSRKNKPYATVDKLTIKTDPVLVADGIVRTKFYIRKSTGTLKNDEQKRWGTNIADVVIIGGGPAGLSAGIHATDGDLKTVLFEGGYIAQTFSDAFMKAVHWMRTAAPASSLVQQGVSSERLLDDLYLAKDSNLNDYRVRGQEARQVVTKLTRERFVGLPPSSDQLGQTNAPVARNELFQHMLDVAEGIINRGGFIVEKDPVVLIRRSSKGLFRVVTKNGNIQFTRKIIIAPGLRGDNADAERVPESLLELVKNNPDNYVPLFNLIESEKISRRTLSSKQPVITSAVLGDPKVRAYIKSLPKFTQFAVMGSGESAAKSVVELLNINRGLHIHLFLKKITTSPFQLPVVQLGLHTMHKTLKSAILRKESLRDYKEFGTPITPQTALDLRSGQEQGQITIHQIGHPFNPRIFNIKSMRRDGKVISVIIDRLHPKHVAIEINGGLVSAAGYSLLKIRQSDFIRMLVKNKLIKLSQYGGIRLNEENGLTSAISKGIYVTGAYTYPQGMALDSAIPGFVFRSGEIIKDILGKRKTSPLEENQGVNHIVSLYRNLQNSYEIPREVKARLVLAAVQPGQNVEKVIALYRQFRNIYEIPRGVEAGLVLAAVQPGQNVEKVIALYRQFRNIYEIPRGVEAGLVLAAVQPGQNVEKVIALYRQFRNIYEIPRGVEEDLVLAAAQSGQDTEKIIEIYRQLRNSYEIPRGVEAELVLAAIQPGQNIEKVIALYRQFRNNYEIPREVKEEELVLATVLQIPQDNAMNSASKAKQRIVIKDKVALDDNGGIDLNQINVKRTGKTVTVQFDTAQLTQLEQSGFEGFTPVITGFQYIKSPFQLLGVNTVNQPDRLAKV